MRDPSSDLRAAAEALGEPLSAAAYTRWRTEQDPTPLSAWHISRRGGWPAACARAGIQAAGASYRRWTREEHIAAVRLAAAVLGEPLTPTAYRRWRANRTDVQPDLTGYGAPEWVELCSLAGVVGASQSKR